MSTTKDTDRVLTIPIKPADAVVTLHDRLYASMTMATNSQPSATHKLSIKLGDDGELNLHFDGVYICISAADWNRVEQGVAEVLGASAVTA